MHWSLCQARRPLSELGPVSKTCFGPPGPEVVDLGIGSQTQATISADACRLFGPQPPLAKPGEPQGRPVDADVSGGFYQPAVVRAEDPAIDAALLQIRLACGLAAVVPQTAVEFRQRYQLNRAPALSALLTGAGEPNLPWMTDTPLTVARGSAVNLRAHWPSCAVEPTCGDGQCTLDENPQLCPGDCNDTIPVGCDGAEAYVRLDPIQRQLTTVREAMRIAWYATAGEFRWPDSGRGSDEVENFADNTWIAPQVAGQVHIWLVVRDDRGGVTWIERSLEVL